MSLLEIRGGVPHVFRDTIDTTGRIHRLPHTSKYVVARNKGATNIVRMFFTEEDFNNDVNYVELPPEAAATPHGEWRGPLEACAVWFKAAAGTSDIELTTFQRRA